MGDADGIAKRHSHPHTETPHFSVPFSPDLVRHFSPSPVSRRQYSSSEGRNGSAYELLPHGHLEGPVNAPSAPWWRQRLAAFAFAVSVSLTLIFIYSSGHAASTSSLLLDSITGKGVSLFPWTSSVQSAVILHHNGHMYLPSAMLGKASGVEHPIHQLIRNASVAWDKRVAKQSKSLNEAVSEYKKRYNRNPPKNFDKWFEFAQRNGVILIDEYDGIDEDVAPFLALDPALLRRKMADFAAQPNSHTFVIKEGRIDISSGHGNAGLARAQDQRDLLTPCMEWLLETNATISPHDGPSVLLDEAHKRRLREAGQRGETVPDDVANSVDDDPSHWGFPLACAPGSRLRRAHDGLEVHTLPDGPSFIYNHVAAMDLCSNPEWQDLHGFTSWPGPRPTTLQPVFSMSRSTMHSDIRLTPLEQYHDTPEADPDWSKKLFDRAVWRGSTTGVWFDHVTRWRSSQRVRLYWMSKSPAGQRLVRFTERRGGREVVVERYVSLADLYRRYLDFAFVGEIVQCTEEDGGCDAAKNSIHLSDGMIWEDQNQYRYFLDIDGNAWSGRFHRLMSTNSLVLKATIFKECYVPIDPSYADLFDVMSFFSGDLNGENGHEDLARLIANAGKQWTKEHWRLADMQAYTSRLLLEWARATSLDRASMDFV